MSERKVRYEVEEGAPFAVHAEGLTIRTRTRKSGVPVTVEIEGVTGRLLRQFRSAIDDELARREQFWRQQRQRLQPALSAEPVPEPEGQQAA